LQESNQGNSRYLTATGNRDGQAVAVKSDGSFVVMDNLQSMSDAPWHSSIQAARSACESADLPKQWGEFEQAEQHNGGVILKQTAQDGTERYAAISPNGEGGQGAVRADGSLMSIGSNTPMSEIPTYPNIAGARDALNKTEGPTRQWGQLEQIGQEGDCVIMKQESSDDNASYFTLTQSPAGETIAVANDGTGTVVNSVDNAQNLPHYPAEADARAACPANESSPNNGGSNEPTDDSTSNGGPTTGDREQDTGTSTPTRPTQRPSQAGLLSGEVAGIPIPVLGGGAVVAAGALASLLGGDDSGPTPSRVPTTDTRASRRSNVTQRNNQSSSQNNNRNNQRR